MISIAIAYKNRKLLLQRTLQSIYKSEYKDFEIIIVDDASDIDSRIEDICSLYDNIKLCRIEPEEKYWLNPCVAYNKAFQECQGNIIIIQNPECYHHGDVLSKAAELVNRSNYITFPVYSLNEQQTTTDIDYLSKLSYDQLCPHFINRHPPINGESGWYNHKLYHPQALHFCSAIHKASLTELRGFDERFALGLAFDDNDFIYRIRAKGFKVEILDQPIVFHQWHYSTHITDNPEFHDLFHKNGLLHQQIMSGAVPRWDILRSAND